MFQWSTLRCYLNDNIPSLSVMPQITDVFWHTIFFDKFIILTRFSLKFCANIVRLVIRENCV